MESKYNGCNGDSFGHHGALNEDCIFLLKSYGQALKQVCCFCQVFSDDSNLRHKLDSHGIPCPWHLYGYRTEDVCAGQAGVFRHFLLCHLSTAAHAIVYPLALWDVQYSDVPRQWFAFGPRKSWWCCCMQFVSLCNLQNVLHDSASISFRVRVWGRVSVSLLGLGSPSSLGQKFANCACATSKLCCIRLTAVTNGTWSQ